MKKYSVYFGVDRDKNEDKIPQLAEKLKYIKSVAIATFYGYTLFEAEGGYQYENGRHVHEKSYKIELLTDKESHVRDFSKLVQRELNQESVLTLCESVERL